VRRNIATSRTETTHKNVEVVRVVSMTRPGRRPLALALAVR
jgi:hypothetical protein